MNEEITPEEQAKLAFDNGMTSEENPFPYQTHAWCAWAKEFGRLNDEYMSLAVED